MATPSKPEASVDGGADAPDRPIEDAVVLETTPAEPIASDAEGSRPKPLELQDVSSPPERGAPAQDRPSEAVSEARLNALAARVEAAERAAATRPEPVVTERKGSPLPGIVGGVLAAAVGFAAAQIVPQGWPIGDTTALRGTVASQGERLQALADQVAAIPPAPEPAVPADLSPLLAQIDALAARVASVEAAGATAPVDLSPVLAQIDALARRVDAAEAAVGAVQVPPDLPDRVAALDSRVKALEALPPGTVIEGAATVDPAATAALEQQIAALKADMAMRDEAARAAVAEVAAAAEAARAALADAQAEAARLQDATATAAQDASARAALGRIAAALETGAPFETAVADLAAAGHSAAPALADHAATGLPTLAALQAGFPDAARAALEAALKADMGDSTSERIATFLRTQVGVRSLAPREGNDPDAVLSRAEAALAAGDLGTALAEAAALPEAGQAAMAGWVGLAAVRQAATAALAELTAAVGG